MNQVTWSPFREMDDFFGRYRNRLRGDSEGEGSGFGFDWRPAANISETEDEYLIKAELPEVERKDVQVAVENGAVRISGERKMDKEEKDATRHRVESFYGTFSRSFILPNDVEEDKIYAKSENGVLKVHLPKSKASKPKSIEIAVK